MSFTYPTGAYASAPWYGQSGTNPLYSYSFGQSPNYGLYGQSPQNILAESPYARMTGQWTPLSSAAIPNLASFLQPTFVDMNGFTGNKGIPMLPSFIGSQSMMNPEQPLYNTYTDYLAQQAAAQQAQYYSYPQTQAYAYPQTQAYSYPQTQGYYQQPQQGYYQQPQQGYAYPPPTQGPPVTTTTTTIAYIA